MAQRSRKRPPVRGRQNRPRPTTSPIRWPILLGAVAAVGVALAGIVAFSLATGGDEDDTGTGNELAQKIEASRQALPRNLVDGLTLGDASAPLEVLVFEDFQCPFCVAFTGKVEPVLVEEYVKTGKLKLTFQNFPILGTESEAAARGAVCAAEQGDAWSYQLSLYGIQAAAGQATNEKLNVGRFDREALLEAARRNGLSQEEFGTCLDAPGTAETVQQQYLRGVSLGVEGTPTFALDGQLVRPADADAWRALLDGALASVSAQ